MTNRIEAGYENGVFRPKVPVQLREGTTAQVTFEEGAALKSPQPLVQALDRHVPVRGAMTGTYRSRCANERPREPVAQRMRSAGRLMLLSSCG